MRAGLPHFSFDVWQTDVEGLDATDLELVMSQRDQTVTAESGARSTGRSPGSLTSDGCVNARSPRARPRPATAALDAIRRALPPRRLPADGLEPRSGSGRRANTPGPSASSACSRCRVGRRSRPTTPPRPRTSSTAWPGRVHRPKPTDAPSSGTASPGPARPTPLRALGREWRSWCDVHVVVDAERFLSHIGYMDEVLAHRAKGERWRLIALEDTGELLTADARERVGQGLSRLLNATDGLLGPGHPLPDPDHDQRADRRPAPGDLAPRSLPGGGRVRASLARRSEPVARGALQRAG